MELHPTARLSGEAATVCHQYLERLPLSPQAKRLVLDEVGAEADPARAMAALHVILGGAPASVTDASAASIQRRLQLACPSPDGHVHTECTGVEGSGHVRLATTPSLHRTPMAPSAWLLPVMTRVWRGMGRWFQRRRPARRPGPDPELQALEAARPSRWRAAVRRIVLLGLVLGQTAAAADGMRSVLPYHGGQPLEVAILVLFTVLFGWVSIGFWTGVVGFLVLATGRDRYSITRSLARVPEIPPEARTAVVMPICNENVRRTFAGLRACYDSLSRTDALERFDFFVLSDSSEPDARVAETKAWLDLCCAVRGHGRIFYRWRRHRIKRKSGNVADFCRRWGNQYRYMVVLDADSIMSGTCLTALVRLMEAHPATGIIQTAPRAAGRETLYARIQQFATRVYGPVFTAGISFWQLGAAFYWGHNAIIRIRPFMRHCALGRLPGWGVFSGEILSHDFVEAALMRRAGWSVWIAYDLPGSYEEIPPNVLDELNRDRRWCQGNLLNTRLCVAEGLHPAHRAVFMAGAMSYLSSPLWLMSLAISTAFLAIQTVVGPRYFVQPRQLFPEWPQWHVEWAIGLAAATGSVLFLPKILGAVLVLARGARRFAGATRFTASVLIEMVFSALLAPICMLFHTQFVLRALTGWRTHWRSPHREDAETRWGEALRRHGGHTLLAIAWAVGAYRLNATLLWWLLPVVGALAISMPLSVYSSRISLGRRFRHAGLFVIPEETRPPLELATLRRSLERPAPPARFTDAVVHPLVNAVACAAAASRSTVASAARRVGTLLSTRAAREGPAALTRRERMLLLSDPVALSRLHFEVWSSPAAGAKWWAEGAQGRPAVLGRGSAAGAVSSGS